ncbi:MAG: prepilin peptidase [Trueperaceae bacterium]|nr:MAG: prepilin peptidase [Trueperaceae bacterium]
MYSLVFLGILGSLIGSFANVVIHRLPQRRSVAFPASHCPHCHHRLSPLELVPVFSWLVLGGRCRSCKKRISFRYPLIELIMAAGFVLLALRWPVEQHGPALLPLLIIFAMLVIMAAIDIDHYILPDSLTLPAIFVGVLGTLLYSSGSGLPDLLEALTGAVVGAGIVVLINRVGGLVLRKFHDTKERLWPIGMDQVNLAALGGAVGGLLAGIALALFATLLNLLSKKTLRLKEPLIYSLLVPALLLSTTGLLVKPLTAITGSLGATGAIAILGAVYWWLRDTLVQGTPHDQETDEEPVAMGFGDVKLAAVLGAILGWEKLLIALFLSFLIGALGGIISRLMGGSRFVPFGPYLVFGGLLALFLGDLFLNWYLGLLGMA